ncbi:putative ankyrin repeat protein RF_0381 [Haliotis asinina]|uniref:putative ankyrin repeat protein RF_0381 n=1 Tax=Haliotis asinina TaxID=109174 RepID=UPI003531AA13
MGDVHAGDSLEHLTIRVGVVEQDLSLWKFSSTKTETKLTSKFKVWKETLKRELTSTFVPSLLKTLVEQAIRNIRTEDDIGHPTNGKVLDEVHSLKDNVQYIKTRLRAITRDLRHVERESDTYRKSVRKERSELTKDIRALQMQVNQTKRTLSDLTQDFRTLNTSFVVTEKEIKSYRKGLQEMRKNVSTDIQSLNIQVNQTISDLSDTNQTLAGLTQDFTMLNTSCCGMRKEIKEPSTTTYAGTTEASTDPSRNNTFPPAPVTTQDLQATPGRDLYDASRRGDLGRAKRILDEGDVDIDYRGKSGMTPVMPAAGNGHRDVVKFLVGVGADVSLVDSEGNNVLHWACIGGDLETVKLIVSMNAVDINSRGWYSKTPVMVAAQLGHRNVVKFLVGTGADVSLGDSDGDNVLHLACIGGDLETVKLIVSMNVLDINSREQYNMTPVMMAAGKGFSDMVKFLVGRGADVSLGDSDGDNVLHYACFGGDLEIVELIVSMNVLDINSRGRYSRTPVMRAAEKGNRDVVEFLVGRGADLALVSSYGNNILHLASREGHLETVKLILSMNVVDINARNNNGQTATDTARREGHQRVVGLLVSRGAH